MAIISCPRGHYYDDEKYSSCPYCRGNLPDEGRTIALHSVPEETVEEKPAEGSDESAAEVPAFVTGWLVCIEGPEIGKDYRIGDGYNRVGRGAGMQIRIRGDRSISRDSHCAIVYEERKNQFYLAPASSNIVYLNGDLVTVAEVLKTGDVITLGNSRFEFVAFCRGERKWGEH